MYCSHLVNTIFNLWVKCCQLTFVKGNRTALGYKLHILMCHSHKSKPMATKFQTHKPCKNHQWVNFEQISVEWAGPKVISFSVDCITTPITHIHLHNFWGKNNLKNEDIFYFLEMCNTGKAKSE